MGKMTSIEKEQWSNLYYYVKNEILMYDESQSIPSSLVMRLKGLLHGKYYDNNKTPHRADYTYETVLYTFQICKPAIMSGLSRKSFDNESARFNYICKIVENNLNDVYLRIKRAKKSEENIQNMDTDILTHSGSKYQKKTEELKNTRLNDLW